MRNMIAFRSVLSLNWDDWLSLHPVNFLFQRYEINTLLHASWSGVCILQLYRTSAWISSHLIWQTRAHKTRFVCSIPTTIGYIPLGSCMLTHFSQPHLFRDPVARHGTARQTRINRQENDGVGNEKKRRRKEDKKWGMRNLIAFRSSLSFNWDDRLSLRPVNILFRKYVINTFSHASWSGLCILWEYRLLSSDSYVLPLLASYAQFQHHWMYTSQILSADTFLKASLFREDTSWDIW